MHKIEKAFITTFFLSLVIAPLLQAQSAPINDSDLTIWASDGQLQRTANTSMSPLTNCDLSEQDLAELERVLSLIGKVKSRMLLLKVKSKRENVKRKVLNLLKKAQKVLKSINSAQLQNGVINTRIAEADVFLSKAIKRPSKRFLIKAEAPLMELFNICISDQCPGDVNKLTPGVCGCGIPDRDRDLDGTPDCLDLCPYDPAKTAGGKCGCGIAESDRDGDGVFDCLDACPIDPDKQSPGACGCGASDFDADNDGMADCQDICPNDDNKSNPGVCGCGVPDADRDGDGVLDCQDQCPDDSSKTSPQVCGCGNIESYVDSDGDGAFDCVDECPSDPDKVELGVCGCGVSDLYGSRDYDHDGIANCKERVSFTVYKGESWPYRGEDLRVSLGSFIFRNEAGETAPGVIWNSSNYTFSFSAWNAATNQVKTCDDYVPPVSLLFKADISGVEYFGFPSTEPLRACEVHMSENGVVGPASNY